MNRQKILEKIKRLNNKKLFLFALGFICIFLLSDLHTIDVKADSNYSNYLTSESINVNTDRALILVQSADSSNNYRNYYETGFLFPYRLSDNMFSTSLTTNPAKYYFSQVYLDNLDNTYSFKSVDNEGSYETNDYIENYTDITEDVGYYNNSVIINDFTYYPTSDILTEWISPLPHYSKIDDNGLIADSIYCINVDDGNFEEFGFTTDVSTLYITNIQVNTLSMYFDDLTVSDDFQVCVYTGSYSTYQKIPLTTDWEYSNLNFTINNSGISTIRVKYQAPSTFHGADTQLWIASCNITIYYQLSNNFLEFSDYRYYNYISNGSGIAGLFPSEYSFTSDSDGSNPAGFSVVEAGGTVNVISGLDGHNKIVELYDSSNPNVVDLQQTLTDKEYGTLEFWWRTTATNKICRYMVLDGGITLFELKMDSGLIYYNDGVWKSTGCACANDVWYHLSIDFECTAGSYDSRGDGGLAQYKFRIYVNNVKYGDYSFANNRPHTDQIDFRSHTTNNGYYIYVDAIDYSWSSGYYINRNYNDAVYELNITSSLQIDRLGNNWDNLELLELEYSVKSNASVNLDLYCKNIDSEIFELVNTEGLTTSFQDFTYTYVLNYTYYSTTGISEFMFFSVYATPLLYSFDKVSLNAIFSNYTINNNGYHSLDLSFNRETSGSTNRGNISLSLNLYKTNFTYTYLENNVIESDYTKNGFVNFSNEIDDIYEFEIQAHIRYGLNTLDIDIVNVYYEIWINYEYNFTLFEQLRFGNNDGNYFRYEMGYESNNFIRLNNTGIFGNYSYSCLKGMRVLRGDTSQNYNRYFTIPFFDEKIDISKVREGLTGEGGGSEPANPIKYFWTYEAFRITYGSITGQNIGNWTIDWQSIQTEKYTAKYYYNPKTIKRSDLGDWYFKISGDYKVSFNFIRNALCDILNLLLIFFQFVWFLLVASLSYIFTYIAYSVIVLLYNYPLYYLWLGVLYGLWYIVVNLYDFGIYMWSLIEYVWLNYLIPFFDWFSNTAIPYIVEFIIIPTVAFSITLIIWIITLGNIDFWELYNVIHDNLLLISDIFIDIIQELMEHIVEVVIFIGLYFLLIGKCFLKHIVMKARGFVNRADSLKQSYEAYLYPIEKGYIIASRIKEILANWL